LGHVQDGRGHGRIEKRIVKVVTVAAGLAFPHAAQAIQVIRKSRSPGSRRAGAWGKQPGVRRAARLLACIGSFRSAPRPASERGDV
jgi:hypothetical protein